MSQLLTSSLVSRLARGYLSNLAMSSNGAIRDADIPTVLDHINDGLKDLFTRFPLSTKEIKINAQSSITHYFIRYEFAFSNAESTQPVKYLDDSACDDFDGRIVKVLEVYDSQGKELFINKKNEPYSVFLPQHDCVQITANHLSTEFYVLFQAVHPLVSMPYGVDGDDSFLAPDTIINIPPALETPLMLLVAANVFGNMSGPAHEQKHAILTQEYETALLISQYTDSASTSENMSNSKLDRAGFV